MKPTLQDIRVDPILSNVSVAYKNEEYVAEKIFPIVKVKSKTGKYYKYDKSKFRMVESLRGMGSKTNEVEYGLSISTAFVVKEHALKEIVPDELIEQALAPLTPEMDAAENVTERLLVEKEYDLAAYMQSTSNITNYVTLSGTEPWNNQATATPISQIQTGKTAIHALIFKDPNTLLLGKEVYDQLVNCTEIINRIRYTQLGVATTDLLAKVFGIDRVIIGGAGYESATEGQTSSMAYIWGKYAWLLYITPRPGIKAISLGYHFQDKLRIADKWYVKDEKGTWVRITDCYTREVVSTECAYMFVSAIA